MNGNCKVCGRTREDHCKDKDGVWWCCDNVSVRASFKIESESDRKIDSINRIAQFLEDAGLYDKVLLSSQRKKYNFTREVEPGQTIEVKGEVIRPGWNREDVEKAARESFLRLQELCEEFYNREREDGNI